ncbi:MAG TPA: NYN domain-containing protein [Gemmatimonadales bacterium]|nr:NYN domain-containing protein [Gemmatimonadales bacterium]
MTPRHLAAPRGEPPVHAPNAALLIDFDNVTLGIRSDLTKELRTLLNSAIIKGKVAVQRAYADWRRYPQYIVPLSESSIDLIFAPAFGSTKKNATDIRLAIDAIELIFTRPEIGTFILLSGDSDFSNLVIKLKEYGKYVIGVGIRESASDILIQNCDEYYSYTDLAGLTKETDLPSAQRDPWELVQEAARRMAANGDVMRSDRLKQVMQQLDPNFDEKNAGFNRFSKFVGEAGHRGLIKVVRLENGQFEIAPSDGAAAPAAPRAEAAKAEPARERTDRTDHEGAAREERGRRGRRGRGRDREREPRGEAREGAERPAAARTETGLTLARAFNLVREALSQLEQPVAHEALRLRMAALYGRDDTMLTADRFQRLLRQAHDAEIVDAHQVGEGAWEVTIHPTEDPRARAGIPAQPLLAAAPASGDASLDAEAAPAAGNGAAVALPSFGLRGRRGPRPGARPSGIPLVGVVRLDEDAPVVTAPAQVAAEPLGAEEPAEPAEEPAEKKARGRAPRTKKAAAGKAEKAVSVAAPAGEKPKRRPRAKSAKKAE